MAEMTDRTYDETSGWATFAGTIATVAGMFNAFYGLVLLFRDTWVGFTTRGILMFDTTAWGWILLFIGVVQMAIGAGLLRGAAWARALAVIWAALNAFGQMIVISVNPWWSLVIITLDLLVIYGLTVGVRLRPEYGDVAEYSYMDAGPDAMPEATTD
jgi:hypothetical protein